MGPQEKKIFMAIAITALLIGAALLYLFILLYRQQRKNLQLQRKVALSEITSLEQERSRIAADLHDDLGPLLAAIKFRVNSINISSDQDEQEVLTSGKLLDEAINRLRQISNDLLPTSLVRKGLFQAIEELISFNSQANNTKIYFEYADEFFIPEEKQIHLFRMAQEAIFNCVKHSKASKVVLALSLKGSMLHFSITDNGCGFPNNKELYENGGRGLISLSNRARMMGGYLETHSEPNKGTILEFEIPI